jgi:hypothetical protein
MPQGDRRFSPSNMLQKKSRPAEMFSLSTSTKSTGAVFDFLLQDNEP